MEYGQGDVGNGMSDPKPVDDNEFAEFMWMGEELDEFDQQVEQQLMEEFLIETCVEQMLRDDDDEESIPPDLHVALNAEMMRGVSSNAVSPGVKTQDAAELASRMADLTLAGRSRLNPNAPAFTLNPNASVFVPRGPPPVAASADTKAESSCDTKESAPTAPSGGEGDGTPEVAHKQEDKSEELNQPDVDQVSKAERKEEPTEPSS